MKFLALFVLCGALALAQGKSVNKVGITTPVEWRKTLSGRIIQGNPAGDNQFPYQVYQIMTRGDGARFACGGSIITSRWGMAAGHCLSGMDFTDAYMGHVRIDSAPVVWRSYNLVVYPEYNGDVSLNHDISLFGFDNDLPLGDNIWPLNVARNPADTYEGQIATASGYGVIYDGGPGSDTLMYVALRVISNDECSRTWNIIPSTICTVGTATEAQGVCSGDSGGPLVIGQGRDATQIGIVSFGSASGCESSYPNGFVRPNHYFDWISSVTGL